MRILGLIIIAIAFVIGVMAVGVFAAALGVGGQANQPVEVPLLIVGLVMTFVAISLLVVGIVVFRRGTPMRGAGSPTVATGTSVGNFKAAVPAERELDGVTYTILYTPPVKGKNARPSVLRISAAIDVEGEFEIVPESGFDRFAKKWGVAHEIQTFDASFDHRCFVRSDTVEFTEAYLGNPDNRGIIANLHDMGFKSVTLKGHEIKAEWAGFDPLKDDAPDLAEEVGARLILLSRKLPADLPEPDLRARNRRRQIQIILWTVLIVFAATIVSLFRFSPVRTSDLFLRALPVFVVGFPVFMFLALLLLRGTSRSHYAWRDLAIVGLILFPVGSLGAIAFLNGLLDDAPAVEHDSRILRKYTTRSRNSTTYHIECDSWRDPGETEDFSVSSTDYGAVIEGQSRLVVTTGAGRLGMEWIKSKHVRQPKGR